MSGKEDAQQSLASAARRAAIAAEKAGASALEQDETGYRGRYIPYAGGSAGWFKNEGVPKAEQRNNYGFETAVDQGRILQKRFERLGAEVGRRQAARRPAPATPVSLTWDSRAVEGTLRDFSERGLRVRLVDDPALAEGARISVRIHPSDFFKTELALLDAEVRWIKRIDQDETAWHLGISFAPA